jgi:hypothetical protein
MNGIIRNPNLSWKNIYHKTFIIYLKIDFIRWQTLGVGAHSVCVRRQGIGIAQDSILGMFFLFFIFYT